MSAESEVRFHKCHLLLQLEKVSDNSEIVFALMTASSESHERKGQDSMLLQKHYRKHFNNATCLASIRLLLWA